MAHDPRSEWIKERYRYASDSYDRTVILVSGAAATLSITFVEKLISGEPEAPGMLLVAWSMFALSVLAITLSHIPAAMGAAAAATAAMTDESKAIRRKAIRRWRRLALGSSIAAGVGLGLGLFFLGLFAYLNLLT